VADRKFGISERGTSMRKVVEILAVLLICIALSSCSGNRPQKAFMGTWEGNHEGEALQLSLMEKDVCIVKTDDQTIAGTWSIDHEDKAVMTFDDDGNKIKVIATLLNDGKIIAQKEDGSEAVVFEKSGSKKK